MRAMSFLEREVMSMSAVRIRFPLPMGFPTSNLEFFE